MIAIDENFRISETGGTGNATIFVNATTENPFSTASTQIEVSSSVGNIKRYVTLNKKAAHGYMYTPVEWISNEDINSRIWIDLGFAWTNTTKAEIKMMIPTGSTANGTEVFGEWFNWTYRSGQYEPVSDTDDLRFFFDGTKCYWDTPGGNRRQLSYSKGTAYVWEFGNQYLKNITSGTQQTGSTIDFGTRTSTVGLFGAPASGGYTHKARFYYIKIWEGDTLVRDIIPVLDKDNIPCFLDKANATFYYYKVNGVPSTGLTAGGAIQELDYLQGNGSDYVILDYIPSATTRIEVDCSGRPASTPSSVQGSGTAMGCENWNNNKSALGGMSIGFPGGVGGVRFYYGTTAYDNNTSQKVIERGVFKLDGSAAYIDDFKVADVTTSFVTQGAPFALFNSLIYNSSNGTTFPITNLYSDAYYEGKIYGVKIYENNVLVRHYVPVKSSSKKGFYDKVLGNFYPSNSNSLIDGNILGNLTFTVIYDEEDITISNETPSTAISAGNTFNLNASTTPTGATLSYSSSDTSIATVDSNGVITAVGKGTATITITAQGFQDNVNKVYYNTTSKAVSVECAYPTQQITITKDTPSEAIGIEGTFDLNVSTTPAGATVTYSSSDTSVATVSNQGIVSGVATGTTTITIVAEGFDDDVNHITYTSASTTVSVTVADGVVETYDFMDGDGNDYIITDYAPNSNSVIEVKYENQGGFGDLIGFENLSTSETFRFEDSGRRITVYGNNSSVYTESTGGVIKQNGNNVEFNGSVIGSTSYISNTDNFPLYIFASNYMNRHENNQYQGRIFYVKVWENNTLVHEWVGATKGNKVGVYDTVTSAFTASQYNDLTVGNEVLPEDSKYFLIKATSSQQGIPPYVHFTKKGTPSGSLYYRKLNDTAWTEVTGDTTVELAGETGYVELKGSLHNNEDDQWRIEGVGIEPQGYLAAIARNEEITSSNNSIAGTYARFYNLFNGNYYMTNITNIIFPTDTDPACYEGMFINCAQIATAPILPATRLRSECYKEMFKNCYYLRTIPSAMLPATTITEDCYYGMFEGCSSITSGPNLPAPSTTQGCYYRMFYGCTSLTELRVFFTDTPAASYINYWLSNIWTPGTLYAPSNATYSASDLQLPSSWTLSKTL